MLACKYTQLYHFTPCPEANVKIFKLLIWNKKCSQVKFPLLFFFLLCVSIIKHLFFFSEYANMGQDLHFCRENYSTSPVFTQEPIVTMFSCWAVKTTRYSSIAKPKEIHCHITGTKWPTLAHIFQASWTMSTAQGSGLGVYLRV